MSQSLQGKQVLILASSGVDENVMSVLQRDLLKAGATLKTVATTSGLINSWNGKGWGIYFTVDANVNATLGSDFDMLVVPSGKLAIEKLAADDHTKRIISHFVLAQKPMSFMGDASSIITDMVDNAEDIAQIIDVENVENSVASVIEYFSNSEEAEEVEELKAAA